MKNKHYLEALVSFFLVGFGQIIKGEGKKGLQMVLAFYFVLPTAVYVAFIINPYLFLSVLGIAIIAAITLWAYNVFDSFTHEPII
jgi:hypothetical protein